MPDDPYGTRTSSSNTGFLAIVDSDTADNTALMFPSLANSNVTYELFSGPTNVLALQQMN